jgi:hypothetical protein
MLFVLLSRALRNTSCSAARLQFDVWCIALSWKQQPAASALKSLQHFACAAAVCLQEQGRHQVWRGVDQQHCIGERVHGTPQGTAAAPEADTADIPAALHVSQSKARYSVNIECKPHCFALPCCGCPATSQKVPAAAVLVTADVNCQVTLLAACSQTPLSHVRSNH